MKKFVLMRTDTDCELPYFMFPQDDNAPVESSFTHDISVAAPFDSIDKILEYVARNPNLAKPRFDRKWNRITIAKVEVVTQEVAKFLDL